MTVITDSAGSESAAAAMAAKSTFPMIYGTPARIADAAARWRDEGVDELLIPDYALPTGNARLDAYDALAEALAPLA